MKGFKKIIASVLLVLAMCCAVVPGEARAEEYLTYLEACEYFGIDVGSCIPGGSNYDRVDPAVYPYFVLLKTEDSYILFTFSSLPVFLRIDPVNGYPSLYRPYFMKDSSSVIMDGYQFDGTIASANFTGSSGLYYMPAFSTFDLLYANFPFPELHPDSIVLDDSVFDTISDYSSAPAVPQVSVPDLSGMTQSEVSAALTAVGLVLGSVTEEDSTTVPSGQIIRQSVAADTSVNEGTVVDIVISAGLSRVTVPDLSGMTQSEAGTALTAAGLVLGSVTEEDSTTVPSGEVISQSVAADSSILYGSVVDIVISAGLPQITVPSLVNMTQSQADTQLLSNGLVLGNVTEQSSTTVPSGRIISQSVAAGSSVLYGTAIDIVISSGVPAVDVPDVSGMSQSDAVAALTSAGFNVMVSREYSDSVPSGEVISQSVSAGSAAAAGFTVYIVLSRGPSPTPIPVGTGSLVDMTAAIMGMFWIFPLNIFLTAALLLLAVGLFRGLKSST